MLNLPGMLGTFVDLLVVVIGFGLIVFVHELGHFLAARWAGIRVLTFAIGIGPALVSWRKGLGFRRGSSEPEYEAWLKRRGPRPPGGKDEVSPTEYRLAALPIGGFVRMLGQDDIDPGAVSDASDSYQRCTPWKRMVVISAGVVMNVVTAALLFIAVFMIGIRVEPPRVGLVRDGSPAAGATAVTTSSERDGLEPGDRIVSVDGEEPHRFDAVMMAVAMTDPGTPVRLIVAREGEPDELVFDIEPEESPVTGLLDLGILPPQTLTIGTGSFDAERAQIREMLGRSPLKGVEPGMTLTAVGGAGPGSVRDVIDAFDDSAGAPVALTFTAEDGRDVDLSLRADPEFEVGGVPLSTGGVWVHEHLLGLAGVLMVHPDVDADQVKQGLKPGDVFERVGTVEFPSVPRGIEEIRSHSGRPIDLVVRRPDGLGGFERIELTAHVKRDGVIGFSWWDTADQSSLVSLPVRRLVNDEGEALPTAPAGTVITRPGTRITSVNATPTATLADVRAALRDATSDAAASGSGATVELGLELPTPGAPAVMVAWALDADAVERLHALGWDAPFSTALFEPERVVLKAEGPVQAIGLGLEETQRVMTKTYLTFARLFQGSVKVEHLKGPVGIAHVGTRIASRGPVWLMFFMALISVNLAVINFLPLPIVDGGQFLMLLYEQFRGKPVPIPVQNAVTLAGLVLIGGVFLLVTFNDVRALLGLQMADLLGLVALLGIGFVAYVCVLVVSTAAALMYPARRTYASAVARNLPGDPSELDEPLAFVDRRVHAGRRELRCWAVEGRDPEGPAVVLSPGWGDSRVGALVRVQAFVPFASRIVMVDPPGHGETPGVCDLGACQSALLHAVIGELAPEGPVVLAGWSLGAGVSIEFAATHDDDPPEPAARRARVVGVVAEAPYRRLRTPAERVMRARGMPVALNLVPALALVGLIEGAGPRWRRFDRKAWAARLACPLLVLHGTEDPVSPIADGRAIASAAPRGAIVETAGAGHNDLWTDPAFRERHTEAVARFFRETITPAPTIPA